ncbi:hypothetical protein KP509_05G063000 [Ceratopteris richardii]|uniref:RING-type domain-containing protein n=1 Tax=Ceratopteris richardii TaxID=49495 RepID=A0A8T2UM93_CERRI|nr:hypothetical protein KP509_05G063000 [Ceratopteris richardii]
MFTFRLYSLALRPLDLIFSGYLLRCAVCLSDYQRNEKLQQLPPCKHSFHVSCIDEWLAKNTTCPICRTSLLHEASVGRGVTARPENFRRWENGVVINDFQDVVALRRAVDALGGASSSMNVSSLENAPPFSTDHSVSIERS